MINGVEYLWQVIDDFGRLFELCLVENTVVLRCTTAKMEGGRRYTSMAPLTRQQAEELIAALRTALGEIGP